MKVETYCGGMVETNGYLITRDGLGWAVDAPEGMCDWLLERRRGGGFRLVGLLLTHGHWDHIVDARPIQAEFRVPVWIHRDSAPLLRTPSLQAAYNPFCAIEPCIPDRELGDEKRAELGGLEWELRLCPGHCPGSLVFHLPEEKILWGGDVLFAGGVGRWDIPGGSEEQLFHSITDQLLPLPDDTRVLPGHGEGTTIGRERKSNPYLQRLRR